MADQNTAYAQRFFESALDYFEQGQYEKAMEHIKKAIDKSPRNPDYHATKGVFLHKMNDLVQAIEAYQQALEVSPNHPFSHFNLGLILMKMGKPIEAIQSWEAVIRANPHDVDATFNIAVALSQLGRRKECIPFFERVLSLKPDHVQSHQNLGLIYRDERLYKKAKFHLEKLREFDSTYKEVVDGEILKCDEQEFLEQLDKGNVSKLAHEFQGLFKGAREEATEALVAILEEDFPRALDLAGKILAETPGDLHARLVRGQAYHGLGRNADAIGEFMGIVAEQPDCVEAVFHLGNLFLEMNELEQALEHFQRVKKLNPNFPLIDENIESIEKKLKGLVKEDRE